MSKLKNYEKKLSNLSLGNDCLNLNESRSIKINTSAMPSCLLDKLKA